MYMTPKYASKKPNASKRLFVRKTMQEGCRSSPLGLSRRRECVPRRGTFLPTMETRPDEVRLRRTVVGAVCDQASHIIDVLAWSFARSRVFDPTSVCNAFTAVPHPELHAVQLSVRHREWLHRRKVCGCKSNGGRCRSRKRGWVRGWVHGENEACTRLSGAKRCAVFSNPKWLLTICLC